MSPAQFYIGDLDAPTPNRPRRIGVCAALFGEGNDEVLLEYRSDSDYWAFISGGVRDDESLMSAIRRETEEETGCVPNRLELLAIYSDPTRITAYPDGNVSQLVTVAFQGELRPGNLIVSEESRDLRFWPLAILSEVNIAPTHREFAQLIIERGRRPDPVVVVD